MQVQVRRGRRVTWGASLRWRDSGVPPRHRSRGASPSFSPSDRGATKRLVLKKEHLSRLLRARAAQQTLIPSAGRQLIPDKRGNAPGLADSEPGRTIAARDALPPVPCHGSDRLTAAALTARRASLMIQPTDTVSRAGIGCSAIVVLARIDQAEARPALPRMRQRVLRVRLALQRVPVVQIATESSSSQTEDTRPCARPGSRVSFQVPRSRSGQTFASRRDRSMDFR